MRATEYSVSIDLGSVAFGASESQLARAGDLSIAAFRYRSGVAGLRLAGRRGEIVVLPFHGQQIWDARLDGRRLTMKSVFDEPLQHVEYTRNYGGYLVHCGLSGLGAPSSEDRHPVHGDLPHAAYDQAAVAIGRDESGYFAEVSGCYHHRDAFNANYQFTPALVFRENSARLEMRISIRNLRSKPLSYMYCGHINFRPVGGARILDSTPDTPSRARVHRRPSEVSSWSDNHRKLIAELSVRPGAHRNVDSYPQIDPSVSLWLTPDVGEDGWSHAMQLLADGSADFVSFRPNEFDHSSRWMVRNGDEEALGLVLPATAEADGYSAELAKGNVRLLEPEQDFTATYAFGALNSGEVAAMQQQIKLAGQRSDQLHEAK